ncbi:TPA: 16S rRNA (cytosine(1402)-N(4))-methyltransferase [Candidatus Falkowbacteria bacterium]|nr:16S rRNA (cytosine(1402)-N(4))-methyltransferase [Candidatus Falkowbacteria bacterium]
MTIHDPVLLNEVIEILNPEANQDFIDGTLGGGGHAEKIVERILPSGRLLGFDWDGGAVSAVKERLNNYKKNVVLINDSYITIKKHAYENGFDAVDGILLDLGLSLDQLKTSGRGFTFEKDEPLDMRYSLEGEMMAADIINTYSQRELESIFREYGEEKQAGAIAKAIIQQRGETRITRTGELVELVKAVKGVNPRLRTNPATKVFQALRIEVNREFDNVRFVISEAIDLLKSGGRLAIITFHSLEDAIVKDCFKAESAGCVCPKELPVCVCHHEARVKLVTKKPMVPSEAELNRNRRSRSAKLRVVEKL